MNHDLNKADFNIDEIVSIEQEGEMPTVDITVEDAHMFFLENGVYTHNSGLNAEVITMESISEAFSKCFIADFIFSCSRTIIDKQTNGGRFYIAKSRLGPDGIILPIHMDNRRVEIEVHESTGETKDEIERVSAKEQEARMKAKLRKMKEDKRRQNKK